MRVYVLDVAGGSLAILEAEASWTMDEILSELEVVTATFGGHPVRILHGDVELRLGQTLVEAGVADDSQLTLIVVPMPTRVITMSEEGTAKIWTANSEHCLRTLAVGRRSDIAAPTAAFSPDGTKIIVGGDFGSQIRDVDSGKILHTLEAKQDIKHAVFSPDGSQALTCGTWVEPTLWDVQSGKRLRGLSGHRKFPVSGEFSPDGTLALTASDDGSAKIWELASGKCLRNLHVHEHSVHYHVVSAVFSPDGKLAFTACSSSSTRVDFASFWNIWDVETGKCQHTLMLPKSLGMIDSAELSPDGLRVLACGEFGSAMLDVNTGECLCTFVGHERAVGTGRFSKDGSLVLTASADGTAKIWDVRSGNCLRTLRHHDECVASAAFWP